MDTARRKCARGFSAPLAWFFHAIRSSTSRSVPSARPYLCPYAWASRLKAAGAVRSGSVPSPGTAGAESPDMPESLSFSTPTAIAVSYAPLATA